MPSVDDHTVVAVFAAETISNILGGRLRNAERIIYDRSIVMTYFSILYADALAHTTTFI